MPLALACFLKEALPCFSTAPHALFNQHVPQTALRVPPQYWACAQGYTLLMPVYTTAHRFGQQAGSFHTGLPGTLH